MLVASIKFNIKGKAIKLSYFAILAAQTTLLNQYVKENYTSIGINK